MNQFVTSKGPLYKVLHALYLLVGLLLVLVGALVKNAGPLGLASVGGGSVLLVLTDAETLLSVLKNSLSSFVLLIAVGLAASFCGSGCAVRECLTSPTPTTACKELQHVIDCAEADFGPAAIAAGKVGGIAILAGVPVKTVFGTIEDSLKQDAKANWIPATGCALAQIAADLGGRTSSQPITVPLAEAAQSHLDVWRFEQKLYRTQFRVVSPSGVVLR